MKIWITRAREFSLSCGGLERVHVWVIRPMWVEKKFFPDLPFSEPDEGCIEQAHWEVCDSGRAQREPLSFGNIFGYGSGENAALAHYVWQKVCEHFHNEPMDQWERLEKEGKSNVKDFMLELEISISFTPPTT